MEALGYRYVLRTSLAVFDLMCFSNHSIELDFLCLIQNEFICILHKAPGVLNFRSLHWTLCNLSSLPSQQEHQAKESDSNLKKIYNQRFILWSAILAEH